MFCIGRSLKPCLSLFRLMPFNRKRRKKIRRSFGMPPKRFFERKRKAFERVSFYRLQGSIHPPRFGWMGGRSKRLSFESAEV